MNSSIIIYASRYGSTEQYARYLSKCTGYPCLSYKEITNLQEYNNIIFLGALYAGSVLGVDSIVKMIGGHQSLIIATVGMVDPNNPENICYIHDKLKKQIPAHLFDEQKIFHLHGRIDYSRMSIKHRLMMYFVYRKLKKTPKENLSVADKTIVETYGKSIDDVDFKTLETLKELICQSMK